MSDPGTTTVPSEPAPAAAPPPAQTATPAQPAPAAPDDVFAELNPDDGIFSRGFVEKLRNEGIRYRTELRGTQDRLQGYDAVFGPYDDADRQVWLDIARTWQTDPNQAATVMRQIAQAVLGEETTNQTGSTSTATPTEAPAPTKGSDGLSELTPLQVQQMIVDALTARDQAAAQERAVQDVYAEVRAAGFDPDNMEGFMVLWLANHQTNGDIAAAASAMKQYQQGIVDNYVQGRANGAHPTPTPAAGGMGATTPPSLGSWTDQRRAAQKFLEAQQAAQ